VAGGVCDRAHRGAISTQQGRRQSSGARRGATTLFYVAVTRARDRLYLSYPVATRNEFYGKPSQFITEVDRSLYDAGAHNDLDDDEVRYEDDEY
jgi:ATP-dependent helicase/DNAse subunit B